MSVDRHIQDFLGSCLASDDATFCQWGGWLGGSPDGYANGLGEDLDRAICIADGTEDYLQRFYGGGDDDPDWQEGAEEEAESGGEEEEGGPAADDDGVDLAVVRYSPTEPHIWLYREAIIVSKSRPLESSACPLNCGRRGIESLFDLTQHLRVVHADSSNHYGAKRILGNPDPKEQESLEAYLYRHGV